jgi:hypothetical protein
MECQILFRPRLEELEDRLVPNAVVAPPTSHPFGATYSQWSARWWQYALSVPTNQSPFLDSSGANFGVQQQWGNVKYLSGVIVFTQAGQPPPTSQNPATAVRTITIRAGTGLFFPVLNTESDNLVPGGPNTNFTVSDLQGFNKASMDMAQNMVVQIDGQSLGNLSRFRVVSPVFSYTLPSNNIDTALTGINVPAQTVSPAVAEGVNIFVNPLSVGQHTIHFAGDFGPGNFALDVTYHINVTH